MVVSVKAMAKEAFTQVEPHAFNRVQALSLGLDNLLESCLPRPANPHPTPVSNQPLSVTPAELAAVQRWGCGSRPNAAEP